MFVIQNLVGPSNQYILLYDNQYKKCYQTPRLCNIIYLYYKSTVVCLIMYFLHKLTYTIIMIAFWLILPVVICLSQRLSHACLSINTFILRNCERLIISVIIYLIVSSYLDNRSNSRANTCKNSRLVTEGKYLLGPKSILAIRSGNIDDS